VILHELLRGIDSLSDTGYSLIDNITRDAGYTLRN
jgi:hypothetical protein